MNEQDNTPTPQNEQTTSESEMSEIVEQEADADDLPQEVTQSYGTGVHEAPGFAVDGQGMGDRLTQLNEASSVLTGGDVDANYEQANAVGDEAVGGSAPTPDMDIVDELGRAVGLEMDDQNFLHGSEILEQRDNQRWELEPKSSEDYIERREGE